MALNAVKELYAETGEIKKRNEREFRFFGCMKAPLKKLQGKYRYQILMRIENSRDDILDDIYYFVNRKNHGKVNAYMEINPNNLT